MDVPYLGISASQIGEQVGQALWKTYQQRGWPAAESAAAGITYEALNIAKGRTDGARRALTEDGFPDDRIFCAHEKTTDVPGAQEAMNIRLTQHPGVKHWLVCAMIDEGVLGGVSLAGGQGTMPGVVVGVLILGPVQNALNLLQVQPFHQDVVRGVILLLAVLFDLSRRRARG